MLPKGTTVDVSTVKGYAVTSNSSSLSYTYDNPPSTKLNPGCYDIRFEDDWKGTGRTMMIITVTVPNSIRAAGMVFTYLLHNTYENIMEYGSTIDNEVAFVNLTNPHNKPNTINNNLGMLTEQEAFLELDIQYKGDIGYARTGIPYVPVDVYSWGYDKSVRTIHDYQYQDETLPGGTYTYKLSYSQSEYATSQDIVFFDVLEGGSTTKGEDGSAIHNVSEWYGDLVDVNFSELPFTDGSTSVTVGPVVYYSSKDRDSFTEADYDVHNTETWSVEKPETITAVAVDCSMNTDGTPFVMKGKLDLNVYLTMKAPKDVTLSGKTAYNESIIYVRHENDEQATTQLDNAAVMIRDVKPEIHKGSTPESGMEDNPQEVYQDTELAYTIAVTNPDEVFTLHDLVVTDTIPEGLNFDIREITVQIEGEEGVLPVLSSPRVSLDRKGRDFTFTVSSLLPGETMVIRIPTVVNVTKGILKNQAVLKESDGILREFPSETTWHEAHPNLLSIKKTGFLTYGVPGAKMQLLDEEGNVVEEWVSTEKAVEFEVPAGTYTVHEVEAPEGFFLAEDVTVVLHRDNTMEVEGNPVNTVHVKDDYTKVVIRKENAKGDLIEGAKLSVYDEAGELVITWETGTEPKLLYGVLGAGKTYTLVEESAPEPYIIADPISFTVNEDGSEQVITMVDLMRGEKLPETGRNTLVLLWGGGCVLFVLGSFGFGILIKSYKKKRK